FTSMDPLVEKYYSVSPYAYVMNNPVNAIDPTGMEVIITGHQSDSVAHHLNQTTKLNLSYDSNNQYLFYTKDESVEYSVYDQLLMKIIDDPDITVKLKGVAVKDTYLHKTEDREKEGTLVFGTFEGNKVRKHGDKQHIIATQGIDIVTSINAEKAGFDRAGHIVAHELMEGYFVAKNFPGAKSSNYEAYLSGHLKALDILPLKITQTQVYQDGRIEMSYSGVLSRIVRPKK
ncbi:MAG: hypothetical protein LUH15_07655, partial [Tannerellaceae bacterium]|nr:hypothetical protein [Tannerellaceae bacterium]